MFQNENFFSNFEPFCGARLWLGGNNEVEKIRRNLHFAHHTVEQWCYETFSFLLKWWSSQLFLAFFISCIFHWQIVSLYHLYYDIVSWIKNGTIAKIVYVVKRIETCFWTLTWPEKRDFQGDLPRDFLRKKAWHDQHF